MQSAMQIEVYPTDADALDAAAALIAERTRNAESRVRVALGGGRSGRAVMVALAGRSDVPWARIEWFLADERCGAPDDPRAHAKVAWDSLFGPRGVAANGVCSPALDGASPAAIAARYAETLAARLGPEGRFDLVALGLGANGELGALTDVAFDARAWVAAVPAFADEPERVSITPTILERAGHVVVVGIGPQVAQTIARALRGGAGPAARVPPSERVTWVVDRDAAGELLKDARPVAS
jgi:6-phosphogluconolactonase/glucosamine-6-phosphate isomerase/deaminase